MGQYHYPVNLTKKQYLDPHKFNDGLKLREFGCSSNGTMTALCYLLASSIGRGGGDFQDGDHAGTWAGDKIAIIGDYSEKGDIPKMDAQKIYNDLMEKGKYTDISLAVIAEIPDCRGGG
jgi:hypothetical protein